MLIKRAALIFVFSCVLLIAMHQSILHFGLQFYLSHAAKRAGYTLEYKEVRATPQTLTLVSPRLRFGVNKGDLQAEAIHIHYKLQPFQRTLNLEITLDRPQMELHNESVNLESLIERLDSSSWLKINGKITNKEASILLADLEKPISFQVSSDHSWGKKRAAHYQIFCEGEEHCLRIDYDEHGGHIEARDIKAENVSQLLHALLPSLHDWQCSSGTMQGHFAYRLENGEIVAAEGELAINNVNFGNSAIGIHASLPTLLLKATPENDLLATLEFLQASLDFSDKDLSYGNLQNLTGKLHISKDHYVSFLSQGFWSSKNEKSLASIHATLELPHFEVAAVQLELNHLNSKGQLPSSIKLKTAAINPSELMLKLQFAHVRDSEFAFAQKLFDNVAKDLNPFTYVSGTLNASIRMGLKNGVLATFSAENIDAEKLLFHIKPWELAVGAEKMQGECSFNLNSPQPKDTLEASLDIDNGQIAFTGSDLNQWNFTHIQTHLKAHCGVLQASSANVELLGLKGYADIVGGRGLEIMRLKFQGKGADLAPFVPENIRPSFENSLKDEEISLQAHLHHLPLGIGIQGTISMSSIEAKFPIDFGFAIERISGLNSLSSQEQFFKFYTSQVQQQITPISALSLIDMTHYYLREETGYLGFRLNRGWIKGSHIPLEKTISPILFSQNQFILSGMATVEAEFDWSGLRLRYGGENLSLENDKLSIQLPKVGQDQHFLPATHIFEFASKKQFGQIPVAEGSYFDKSTGLLFTDIHSSAKFENNKIHLDDMEAFSNGMYFAGHIDIDYSNPLKGYYDVLIKAHTIDGSFTQAQHILAHFDKPLFLTKIPLEGFLNCSASGGELFFAIKPHDFDFQARLDGTLSEGKLSAQAADVYAQDINLNFHYDHQKHVFAVTDLQGILLLGSPHRGVEYTLKADKIHFTDLSKNQATFDIQVSEENAELLHIAGKTRSFGHEFGDQIEFLFDLKHSHFGNIYPTQVDLVLKDWNRIDHLQLQTQFQLSGFLHNLQKLGRSRVLFLSQEFLSDLTHLKTLGGEFNLDLGYDGTTGTFAFNISGNDALIEQHHIKEINLSGYNRENRWLIEQFQLDQLSCAAEFQRIGDLWKIDFLGLRYDDALVLGMEGNYHYGDPVIAAQVHLMEVNLDKLPDWAWLSEWKNQFSPKGSLKAKGEISFTKQPGWSLDLNLSGSFKDLSIDNITFKDSENFTFHYNSQKGLNISDLKSGLVFGNEPDIIHFDLKNFQYDGASQSVDLSETFFSIDASRLPWLATELNRRFSAFMTPEISLCIAHLKSRTQKICDSVNGSIQLHFNCENQSLLLKLNDDNYSYQGEEFDIRKFSLNLQNDIVNIAGIYRLNQEPLWLSIRCDRNQLNRGTLLVTNEALDQPGVVITWSKGNSGITLEKIQGQLRGLNIDLQENYARPSTHESWNLVGSIEIDCNQTRTIVPSSIAQAFASLEMGRGYHIEGELEIAKSTIPGQDRLVRFSGMLTGNDIELKGYRFKQFSSQMIFDPYTFHLLDCTLSDPAGSLYIGALRADRLSDDSWYLTLPLLTVYEFRPSLLCEVSKPSPELRKPLVVRQLHIQDVSGTLGDPYSFNGHGLFHFENHKRKSLQNTIFAIPAEILTRIGLNLSVLTPVQGTIHFELKDAAFQLTKFKHVHSDRKISKFYLASSGPSSTIDFDGNLNVQVRFKQSTLLLKLVEMFTINIHGTLKKPVYTLHRQKYLINKEVFATQTDETAETK